MSLVNKSFNKHKKLYLKYKYQCDECMLPIIDFHDNAIGIFQYFTTKFRTNETEIVPTIPNLYLDMNVGIKDLKIYCILEIIL